MKFDRRLFFASAAGFALVGCDKKTGSGQDDGQTELLDGITDEQVIAAKGTARATQWFVRIVVGGGLILLPEPSTKIVLVSLAVGAAVELVVAYLDAELDERRFRYQLTEHEHLEISNNGYVEFETEDKQRVRHSLGEPEYSEQP